MRRIAVVLSVIGTLAIGTPGSAEAQCTLPHQLTNGQVADATQVMANFNALVACLQSAPGGATNSIQINAGGGNFGGLGPLGDGQIAIGSTGNAPQAATLTAGSGIAITNGPGSISISTTGGAAEREFGPFLPPSASLFTFIDSPASITPTVTDVANVGLVYSAPVTSNTAAFPAAYLEVPTTVPWTLTFRASYSATMGNYPGFGIWVRDTAGKMLGEVVEANGGQSYLDVKRLNSSNSFNANPYAVFVGTAPNWFRVSFDGTNIQFSTSWDGQNWLIAYSETSTAFLNGSLQYVGIGGMTGISNTSYWRAGSKLGAVVTYWNLAS